MSHIQISEEASARFLREARAVARLSHPNIITIHDVGREDAWHYLVLEYIPGQNLYSRMVENGGPLAIGEAVRTVRGVLAALGYAHQQGMIHRDVKPQNVMVTPSGHVKVTDFGLVLTQGDLRLTREGGFVGTAYYVAPEVALGAATDHRADLYAVGAMLHELLTGSPPFVGESTLAIVTQILNSAPPLLRSANPKIPQRLERIVARLLAKDPAQRFGSAEEVLAALPDIPNEVQGEPIDAVPISRLERIIQSSSDSLLAQQEGLIDRSEAVTPELLLYVALEDATSAVEAERRRLADLLGSSVIEPLNLLLSQASAYEQTLAPQMRMAVSVLASLARQVLQQTRDLEANLHPTVLETLGLEPALETLVNQKIRAHGLQISLVMQRLRERLPTQIELALFRAAQDALDRAVKSARASQASIRLEFQDKRLVFSFVDNGITAVGIDNLNAARQRIRQMGGSFETRITSQGSLELTISFVVEPSVQLTPRERDVLQLIAEGLTNKEIARQLAISPRTVNFHLDNLYSKLGISTRTEAAIYALRRGWVRKLQSDPG